MIRFLFLYFGCCIKIIRLDLREKIDVREIIERW